MSDVIETYEHEGFEAKVFYDSDAECPREYMLTHIITPGGNGTRRYTIDDRRHPLQAAHDELRSRGISFGRYVNIFHPEYVVKPCFMYDHGNVRLSAETFLGRAQHANWDSGMIGWAIIELDTEYGITFDPEACMEQELGNLSDWMNGETYYYTITDPRGDEVDSCHGYVGMDSVEEAVRDAMYWLAERAPKQLELELI